MKTNNLSTHHIDPRSRLKGKGILGVCRVPIKEHQLYHSLFGNMCPEEIVEYLNKEFWNDLFEISINVKNERKWKKFLRQENNLKPMDGNS